MGIVLVMLAALLWGVSGGIAAILIERGWDPLVVSFYRGVVGFACFAAWWLARFAVIPFPGRRAILWSALAGLGVAGNFIFYFLAISQANVAVAVTLMYTAPIYVCLVSVAAGSVRLNPGFVVAIGAVLLGVALLTQLVGGENLAGLSFAGVAAGIAAGVSYAVFLFGFRNAALHTSPVEVLAVAFLVFMLVMAPLVDPGKIVAASLSDEAHLFLLLGLFGAGISFVFYVLGLRRAKPVAVALVAAVEPVTASLFGLAVLGQGLAPLQWLGMVVIITTVTALAVRQH
ncbi:MAG: DMT family transporter [Guyparkeria sp.]